MIVSSLFQGCQNASDCRAKTGAGNNLIRTLTVSNINLENSQHSLPLYFLFIGQYSTYANVLTKLANAPDGIIDGQLLGN